MQIFYTSVTKSCHGLAVLSLLLGRVISIFKSSQIRELTPDSPEWSQKTHPYNSVPLTPFSVPKYLYLSGLSRETELIEKERELCVYICIIGSWNMEAENPRPRRASGRVPVPSLSPKAGEGWCPSLKRVRQGEKNLSLSACLFYSGPQKIRWGWHWGGWNLV